RLLHVVPVRALAFGFAAILLASAIELILHTGSEVGRSELTLAAAAGLFLLGLAAGTLAGLLGVGGGVVLVPGMVILFHLLPATAKGTSLAVIIPTALAGTWRNLRERNADVAVATAVGLAGVLTAFAMSKVSVSLDEDVANAMFAVLMILVAVRMVYEQLSRRPAAAH